MRSALVPLFVLALLGCGPDARMVFAEESVRVSARALAEAETAGGEHPVLVPPLEVVSTRLRQTERSIELWRDHSGPLGYRTFAPCLREALLTLRAALEAESVPIPRELDEAEAMLEELGGRCGRAAPSSRARARSERDDSPAHALGSPWP